MTAPPGLAPFSHPSPGSPGAQTPEGFGVPAITRTGWEKRIQAHLDATGEYRSRGQVKSLAAKIARRAERMQNFDPDDLIRKAIDYADPTGEDAVWNVMRERAS